jgi:hypothetical protein
MAAVASMEQAEKGTREAPIEGTVRPGAVMTPQMKAAVSMVNVPRPSVAATSQEKMMQIVSPPVRMEW